MEINVLTTTYSSASPTLIIWFQARKDDESVIKMWEDALLKFTCEDPQKFDEFCDYLEEKYGNILIIIADGFQYLKLM